MKNLKTKLLLFALTVCMVISMTPAVMVNAATTSDISSTDYIGGSYKAASGISLSGSAHIQSYGDVNGVWNSSTGTLTLGTMGESKRLEEITIDMKNNTGYTGTLQYKVHRQTYGWTNWLTAGQKAGTHGEGKRLEAIELKLTDELAEHYSVVYVAHIQTYGWNQGPVSDGAVAGTSGEAKRVECIQIRVVPKTVEMGIQYRVHRQTYGWEGSDGQVMYKKNGDVSGTTGQSKRLEGIEINLTGNQYKGSVEYKTHVQSYG